MSDSARVHPILKWAGGKRQLVHSIGEYVPKHFSRYYEPFIGGGAILFSLQPADAIINDFNWELINLYEVVRDAPNELISILKWHKSHHSKEHYYSVRGLDRDPTQFRRLSNVELAARTLYLNKTCYNGLYRVNSKGQFNTPMGKYKNPNIVNEEAIRNLSDFFNRIKVKMSVGDYKEAIRDVNKNDFVYFDPPYQPISETSAFTNYTKEGFSKSEQVRLKTVCDELTRAGVKFLQSNSDSPEIRELYREYAMVPIPARRFINSKPNGRAGVGELLIYNY